MSYATERAADRELALLDEQLDDPDISDEERREIIRSQRDIERDLAEEDRWREDGQERGWC